MTHGTHGVLFGSEHDLKAVVPNTSTIDSGREVRGEYADITGNQNSFRKVLPLIYVSDFQSGISFQDFVFPGGKTRADIPNVASLRGCYGVTKCVNDNCSSSQQDDLGKQGKKLELGMKFIRIIIRMDDLQIPDSN